MRVVRGRAETIPADRALTGELLDRVPERGEPFVRVWTPHRQVAFGRRDGNADGYRRARAAASDRGFVPVERDVGGHAVAYDGTAALALARGEPIADERRGLYDRYDRLLADVRRALANVGVETERGEPPASFCPGQHSLQARLVADRGRAAADTVEGADSEWGKLVGIAQRVRRGTALTAGVCLVDARRELADVLAAVYGALDVPLDPRTVGTVAAAGGPADPDRVRAALEAELVGEATPTVERVEE